MEVKIMNEGLIYGGIIIIAVVFAIFIWTREFWCWYWKINERLEEQRKTNELLTNIYHLHSCGNENDTKRSISNDIPEL